LFVKGNEHVPVHSGFGSGFGPVRTPAAGPKVTATITVRKSPDDVAVDSAGKLVYVTDSGDDTV